MMWTTGQHGSSCSASFEALLTEVLSLLFIFQLLAFYSFIVIKIKLLKVIIDPWWGSAISLPD